MQSAKFWAPTTHLGGTAPLFFRRLLCFLPVVVAHSLRLRWWSVYSRLGLFWLWIWRCVALVFGWVRLNVNSSSASNNLVNFSCRVSCGFPAMFLFFLSNASILALSWSYFLALTGKQVPGPSKRKTARCKIGCMDHRPLAGYGMNVCTSLELHTQYVLNTSYTWTSMCNNSIIYILQYLCLYSSTNTSIAIPVHVYVHVYLYFQYQIDR